MKKSWVKRVFRDTLLLIFALVSVSTLGQVKAAALADGSYTVPAEAINKDTGGSSAAGAFLGDTANVVVNNGTYKISVPITSMGQAALKSASVGQSSVLDGSNLTFMMSDETPKVQVDYHIVVAMLHLDKTTSAYEAFDWSKVMAVKGSGSLDSSTTNVGGSSASSNSAFSSASSSSSSSVFSSSSSSSSALSSSSSSSSSFSSSSVSNSLPSGPNTAQVSKLNYTVFQADDKSTSAANQFYTHEAEVEKLADGSYQVTMHVQYDKNSGMSAKGFVPLTVNNQKVSNVNYGSTAKAYTASFSFTAPTLDALIQASVKSTIHVSVPTMGMSSDFDVYYHFIDASTAGGTGTTKAAKTTTSGTNDSSTPGTGSPSISSGSTSVTDTHKVSKMRYTVLQANDKSTSEANKFYTHEADVKKLANGSYQVTMHVQYGKNSGMSAKGFTPLTVNGQKVSHVNYGSTAKTYTDSFSFTVPTLDALTQAPVKGTIHVSVPMMSISSDFEVYYHFTGASATGGTDTTRAAKTTVPDTSAVSGRSANSGAKAT